MTKHSQLGLTLLALVGTTALACSEMNAPIYFAGDTIESMGNDEVFPTSGLALRFRAPTEAERMKLDMQRAAVSYDMDIPWVSRDKVHIEITYRVTNLSGEAGAFALIVDGASEYTQYDTQAVADGPRRRRPDHPPPDDDGGDHAGSRAPPTAASCERTTSRRASWIWTPSGAATTPTWRAPRSPAC